MTHAVDAVVTGRNRNAFCAVRPPGHHAGTNGLLEDAVRLQYRQDIIVGLGEHTSIRAYIVVDKTRCISRRYR